jgi:hypothetical protein
MECLRMLVVMIPGADHAFWNHHEQRIAGQPPDIVEHKVDDEIDNAKRKYKKNRNPVRGKSEHRNALDQGIPDTLILPIRLRTKSAA